MVAPAPPTSGRSAPALYLQYCVGPHICGLQCRWVEQVIPAVELTPVPDVPRHLRGLLRYHAAIIPVLDLCELLIHRPAAAKLSTRIILLRRAPDAPGAVLGVLAEQVLSVLPIAPDACRTSSLPLPAQSLISGMIAETPSGWIHLIEPARLLPLGLSDGESQHPIPADAARA